MKRIAGVVLLSIIFLGSYYPLPAAPPAAPTSREAPSSGDIDRAEVEIAKTRSLQRSGDLRGALRYLKRAKAASPLYGKAYYLAAEIHLQREDVRAAVEEMDSLLSRKPEESKAHNLKGLALCSLDETGAAEAAFRKALEIDPSFVEARFNLAVLLSSTGRTAAALKAFMRVWYQDSLFYSSIGRRELADLGRIPGTKVLPVLKRAEMGGPDFHRGVLALENVPAERISSLLEARSPREERRRRLSFVERERVSARDTALRKGLEALAERDPAKAKGYLTKVRDAEPENALAALALEFVEEEEERTRLWRVEVGGGVVRTVSPVGIYTFLQRRAGEGPDEGKAVRALEAARSLKPEDPAPRFALARVYLSKGREGEAEKEWIDVLSLRPGSVPALVGLYRVCVASERYGAAETWLRKLVGVLPEHAAVRSDLGAVLTRRKKFKEAEAQLREAERMDPEFAAARYNLACCLALQGKNAAALKSLEEALRLGFGPLIRVREDPDLERLRRDARFLSLLNQSAK